MTRKEESPAVETRESPGGATETIARHPSRGDPASTVGARSNGWAPSQRQQICSAALSC